MEIMRSLNKCEAEKIFAENAILINDRDCITFDTVVKLFGKENADFPAELGKDVNYYAISNSVIVKYLSLRGFYKVVTYHNIKQQKRGK